MPDTPTTPDGLWRILDTDTPDVPRDINELARTTQDALNRLHATNASMSADLANINTLVAALVGGYNNGLVRSGQLVAVSAATVVMLDQLNADAGVTLNSGTGKLTAVAAGSYACTFTIDTVSSVGATRAFIELVVNGDVKARVPFGNDEDVATLSAILWMPAGSVFWAQAYHTGSSGTATLEGKQYNVKRIGL